MNKKNNSNSNKTHSTNIKTISSIYTQDETINEMNQFFQNEGFIQLNDFFKTKNIQNIRQTLLEQKFISSHKPMFHSKKTLNTQNLFEHNTLEFIEFFKSKEFIEYIEKITGFELHINKAELNLYEHKDFIILNDKNKREEIIEIIYDLSDNYEKELGGTLTYVMENEEIVYLEPTFNTLTILYKTEDMTKYLKYINNKSKNKKILRNEISLSIIEESLK